jgi:hypothetical protein
VLHRIEVAQHPSVKDLPQFPRFQDNIRSMQQLINARIPVKPDSVAVSKEQQEHDHRFEVRQFVMHDIRTQATKLAGLRMFIDADDAEHNPHIKTYLSAIKAIRDDEKRVRGDTDVDMSVPLLSNRNLIDLYGQIADTIVKHGPELYTKAGSTELEQNFIENAKNTARLWPMLRSSALLTSSALREDYVKVDQYYRELKTMKIPFEQLAKAYGREIEKVGKVLYPKGSVDGFQGMIIFNLVQELRKNGVELSSMAMHGDKVVIKTKAVHSMDKDRLFKPAEGTTGTLSGDGLYAMKELHATLAGLDVVYSDDTEINTKPPHIFTFSVQPGTGNVDTGVHPDSKEHAHFPQFADNVRRLHTAMHSEAERDKYIKWEAEVVRYPHVLEDAEYRYSRELEQWEKNGKRGQKPEFIPPLVPEKPLPPYDISGSLQKFVLHDVNGVVTIPRGFISALGSLHLPFEEARMLQESTSKLAKIFDNPKQPLSERLYAMDTFMRDVVKHLGTLEAKAGREAFGPWADYIDKSKRVVKIWDMLSHSSRLLSGVADMDITTIYESYDQLKQVSVRMGDIVPVAIKDADITVEFVPQDRTNGVIDGVQGIMLFNLLKNAKVFKKSYIRVIEKNGELTVQNDAVKPVDTSHFFQPMKKGEGGNTGFGLFTMKHIFGALAGRDVSAQSIVDGEGGNAVQFHIGKPFRTAGARA